jgi:hypothetical protein
MEILWYLDLLINMDKRDAAQKIVKLLALYSNSSAEFGEKNNSLTKINEICNKYHLRLEGNLIIDTDIEEENKKRIFEQKKLESIIEPEKTNMYVIYKGKKYYSKKGSRGGPVPRSEYINTYITAEDKRKFKLRG